MIDSSLFILPFCRLFKDSRSLGCSLANLKIETHISI